LKNINIKNEKHITMPFKDTETTRAHYLKNKEKINEKRRLNYKKNKEKVNERQREYSQTEKGQKINRIGGWQQRGIICEDFDKMYKMWFNKNNCDWCNKEFGKKNLEHNHYSGEIRGIVCNSCNMKISYKDRNYQKCMLDLVGLFIK